jgi:hypothetical protein
VGAWRQAADELGISVEAPFDLMEEAGPISCIAHIACFGRPAGTVVLEMDSPDVDRFKATGRVTGYYCSVLAEPYERFEGELS